MGDLWLYVYDLTEGVAYSVSKAVVGFPTIEGIWHSSLVINGYEIEFGPYGIRCTDAGSSPFTVVNKHYMGKTDVDMNTLKDYLSFLNHTKFNGKNYNLLKFNCNCFTNFLTNELVQKNIPSYLLKLPEICVTGIIGGLFSLCTSSKRSVSSNQK